MRFFPRLSFRARLTLTIAGSFIGAMLVILVLALVVADRWGITIISGAGGTITMIDSIADAGEIVATIPDTADVSGTSTDDTVSVVSVGDAGTWQLETYGVARIPTFVRWSIGVLVVFALIAMALAWWISRRSLARIGTITQLARGISETGLQQRLHLTGPDDEIRQLGDTFDGMLDRLETVFTRQDQFIANASHELRTPLTTTRTALEIPLAQGRVPDELLPNITRALDANARSERLIASLLVLARGRAPLFSQEGVVLAACVGQVRATFAEEIAAKRLVVREDLDRAVAVHGDATLIEHLVRNLVENAVRYTPPAGEIGFTVRRQDDEAILEIRNTGAPIAAADLVRLTEPFSRHDATRMAHGGHPEGFGLGLAIVERVAELHGGSLALTAPEAGGLVVTVTLPVADRKREEADAHPDVGG